MKQSTRKLMSLVLTLVMGLMTLCNTIVTSAGEVKINGQKASEGAANTSSFTGEGYTIEHHIINYEANGYQDNITVTNTGDKVIHNWSLKFKSPYEIYSIYNGEWQTYENGYERCKDDSYIITNHVDNADIEPGSCVQLSCRFRTEEVVTEPTDSRLIQKEKIYTQGNGYTMEYDVNNYRKDEYQTFITVTNTGEEPINNWSLKFDCPYKIDSVYNGAWENYENGYAKCEDRSYLITNNGVNANIEVGEFIKVSYIFKTQDEVVGPDRILVLYDNMGEVIDPLEDDFKYLRIGYNPGDCYSAVTRDIMLIESGQYGSTVEWASSDEQTIDLSGKVNRPSSEPKSVQLTAKLTYEGRTLVKKFTVTVMNVRNFEPSNVKDLSVDDLAEMNSGYDNYNIKVNQFGYITHVYGKYSDVKVDSYETALYSLYSLKTAIGISNPFEELKPTSVRTNETGSIYKFNQVYKGITVYSNMVTISVDPQGNTRYLMSDYFPINSSVDVTPKITYEEALKSIEKKYIGAEAYEVEDEKDRLYISNYYGKVELVWKVYFNLLDDIDNLNKGAYEALVTTTSGDVVYRNCIVRHSSMIEVNGKDLNGRTRDFKVKENTGFFGGVENYTLEDEERNIFIYDAQGSYCSTQHQCEVFDKTAWQPRHVSAMANMQGIYDYYYNTFNRISYDDAWCKWSGNNITVYINTGLKDNAMCDIRNGIIYMGTGTGQYDFKEGMPLEAGEDGMCHEYTHAIVAYETGLDDIDKGVSSSIDEAYADIFSCFYDSDRKGYMDWLIGEDTCIKKGLRDLSDPKSLGGCAKFGGENFINYKEYNKYFDDKEGKFDTGGVHQNSTIISHAAYLMHKNGIGFDDLKKLWYESLCLGYSKNSDFYDVRLKVKEAARNLEFSWDKIYMIDKAFDEVNVKANCIETDKTYFNKIDEINERQYSENVQLNGKVVMADLDNQIANNKGIKSVSINVFSFSGAEKYGDARTDSDGIYGVKVDPECRYMINFEKENYISEKMYVNDINPLLQPQYYCETVELISKEYEGLGGASGKIISALTGSGIDRLTLNVRRGINNIYTDIIKTIQTDSNGNYILDSLEAGNYCVEIINRKENGDSYIPTFMNIKVLGNNLIDGQNGVISTDLERNQIRVVLSWEITPRDLDSHMLCDLPNATREGHVYYTVKSFYKDGKLVCRLDLDDTDGYGPETTTIYHSESGIYTFYVYNFSGEDRIDMSQAVVRVYMNGSAYPVYTFNVPQGAGEYWTVFRYNGATRTIIPLDEIVNNVI